MHLQHMSISINECFYHKTGFSQKSQLLFMFQYNEHVEMNKFLCSLTCTWMTITDSQFYIIDSLSLDVHWNEMLTWWLRGCIMLFVSIYI